MAVTDDPYETVSLENAYEWLNARLDDAEREEFHEAVAKAAWRMSQREPGSRDAFIKLVKTWVVSARLHEDPAWQRRMAASADTEHLREGRSFSMNDIDEVLSL